MCGVLACSACDSMLGGAPRADGRCVRVDSLSRDTCWEAWSLLKPCVLDANIPYVDVRLVLVRAGKFRSAASGARGLVVRCYSRAFGARALVGTPMLMPNVNLLLLALCSGRRPQC